MTKARQTLLMVCCLFLAGGIFAQNPCDNQPEPDQEYTQVTSGIPAYAYVSIVGTGDLIAGAEADDAAGMYALQHPVVLYGAPFTDLFVGSNGFVSSNLADGGGGDLSNDCPVPAGASTGVGDGRFYVLHDDLDMGNNTPATEGVYGQYNMPAIYPHPADAGMGAHVIQWFGDHFPGDAVTNQVDFQAVFYDNGDVLYIYNLDIEGGSGSTSGWQESGTGPDGGTFTCNTAGAITPGTTFALSAHGTADFADPVGACQMFAGGVEVVNLAAITEINVTLNEACRAMLISSQILTGDFDVDDNGMIPMESAYSIVVQDSDPSNGPIIDGCGRFIWNVTVDTTIAGFTTAWGYVNAEDKTSPVIATLPVAPDELFCNEVGGININTLPANVSRCFTQSGQDGTTLFNSMNPQLRARLLAGGGIPDFFDGCSNVQICVNDLISNNGPCDSIVITRVFTATDGDCPSVSGESNPATVVSYQIVFTRPSVDSVAGVDSLSIFSCDDNPPLLPPNGFGNANPAPTAQDYPFLLRASGAPIYLSESGFCNIGATFQDGPRIVTCANTYKFVRTFTVIDWCDVNNIRTFTQLVKVGDFAAPTITAPTQDLNFDGIPDQGPLFFSTNTPDCESFFLVPAGSAVDNCDPNPTVTVVIYPNGDTLALGFGPFAVGAVIGQPIPRGNHLIRYFATDNCGNVETLDIPLTIGDQTAPVAICENGLNISIGGPIGATGGVAQLCAVDVNRASYDDCSPINLAIVRVGLNDQPLPGQTYQPCLTLTCADLGIVRVSLRVTDDANLDGVYTQGVDNTNFCWLDVLVEDKTAPICIAPAPIQVNCDDLSSDFPQDLNVEFANDPVGTAALLDAQFGTATGLDNCPNPTVTQNVVDTRNSCGVGFIQRSFTVTDGEGFTSPPNCAQLIQVIARNDYTIVFPGDQENDDCVQPDYNGVTFTENGCDLITVSTQIDTFTATADECYKLRITYEVLNWCEYNTLDEPYTIPRDADGDNVLDMDTTVLHILPMGPGLADDIAILDRDVNRNNFNTINELDTGDGGIVPGSDPSGYGLDGSRGAFIYRQFIKVYDDTPPTLVVVTPDSAFCSFDNVNCDGDALLGFSITDECSPVSVNAIVELDAFIQPGAGGVYTLADFVADGGNVTTSVTNNNDGTFTIDLPNLPIGRHAVRIRATDGCGNTAIDLIIFEIADCKAPTPICINGLTVTLMPDGNGGGMADIWVSDFIASPSSDCSGPVKFAIYTNDFVINQGPNFVPNPLDTGLILTCDSDETTMIRIYAIDAEGQFDYCLTTLLVQENTPGICDDAGVGSMAGVILTSAAGAVPGVNVTISGDMNANTTTNAQGLYSFSGLPLGEDFTIAPAFDSYEFHLQGVSTFDLVLISKHILGIDELTSAYSLLAADANADENVSVQDIIAIRRLILGLDLAYTNSPAWMFIDGDFTFPNQNNPWVTAFPEVFNQNNLATNVLDADFVAIMVGNVDGGGMANLSGQAEARTNGNFGFNVANADLVSGNTYTVDFTAAQAAELEGFQGTIALGEGLEFIGMEYGVAQAGNFNTAFVNRGLIAMSYNVSGNELSADDVLFSLVVRAAGDIVLSDALTINSDFTAAEAYTNGQARNLGINFGGASVAEAGFEMLQNSPNPVADVTTIGFNLPVASEVNFTVQDITGKVVLRKTVEGVAGYNSTTLNASDLGATGVLTYTMVAGDYTATKKMVVVQ